MAEKKIDAGAYIYNEGDTADVAYTVVSGKVEILEIINGSETQADVVDAGRVFGEFAIFDPQQPTRPHAARAIEASVIASITPEEFQTNLAQCPKPILPILQLACEKMKSTKVKTKTSHADAVLESDISKITVAPASDKLKSVLKPVEVPIGRLPFRIGGYPEGGEISRRDQLHLAIASQNNPLRVSRQHCEIGVENKTVVITDLGSRFCTWVNGTMIGRGRGAYIMPLKKGANEIALGAADGPYKFTVTCK
jgi:hypothetical protein